jgi:hypothetical protein
MPAKPASQPKLAIAGETTNRKVGAGQVYVTHASQGSCPASCPFIGSGCYAENGPQGFVTRRLNRAQADAGADALAIAQAEADAIRALPDASKPLRLHVVGDCASDDAALMVSDAVGDRTAWTYTHAWRDVQRAAWRKVSVLASCETDAEAAQAASKGYATARVVRSFPEGKPQRTDNGFLPVPCPEQTGKAASCADCRLCWDDDNLRSKRLTILFAAHGATRKVAAALEGRGA